MCVCMSSNSFIAVAFLAAKGLFSSSEAASSYGQAYISSGTSTATPRQKLARNTVVSLCPISILPTRNENPEYRSAPISRTEFQKTVEFHARVCTQDWCRRTHEFMRVNSEQTHRSLSQPSRDVMGLYARLMTGIL